MIRLVLATDCYLTYMSIHDEISRREEEGLLVRVVPRIQGAPELRAIYVTDVVYREIFSAPGEPANPRMALLHADLDRFISGMEITVGGRYHKTAYMKCLEPERDEIWEIRSVDPDPQFRLFGRFADTDLFIGTHLDERAWLGLFKAFFGKDLCGAAKRYGAHD
jgi:hypothetical protein